MPGDHEVDPGLPRRVVVRLREVHPHDRPDAGAGEGLVHVLGTRRPAGHLAQDPAAAGVPAADHDPGNAVALGGLDVLGLPHQCLHDVPQGAGGALLHEPREVVLDHVVRGGVDVEHRYPEEPRRVRRLVVVRAHDAAQDL